MSESQPEQVRRFLELLPLTEAVAGLSHAEHGKYYNEDQMEIRARNLKLAYRYALNLIKELGQE